MSLEHIFFNLKNNMLNHGSIFIINNVTNPILRPKSHTNSSPKIFNKLLLTQPYVTKRRKKKKKRRRRRNDATNPILRVGLE